MLMNFWYAVEFADRVGVKPGRVTVLGRHLALYRTADGQPVALADRCVHRGASLSDGKVRGGCLACPYHGWEYAADGRCMRIPASPPERGIPQRARVNSYPVQERYGFIWVFLGEVPEAERPLLPVLAELEQLKEHGGRLRAVGSALIYRIKN
jgi:phenylpropionate dioxygenase-like ring-hydroxylating dioxygenase large terminal subunit